MSDLALRTNSSIALVDEAKLTARLKLMIYNGKKLSDDECRALATYAAINDLNPFVGECYFLPGVGPTPGIAGWRKKADEQLEYEARRAACPSARFWCDYLDAEPRETGALVAGDIAVKAVLHDTITKNQWEQSILRNMIELLKSHIENAATVARDIAGAEPTWTAVGIVKASENFGPDKMPRYERACKRAEKAAIRKRFPRVYLPEPAGFDDVVDGSFVEQPQQPTRSQAQNLSELGYNTIPVEHDAEPPITPAPNQPELPLDPPARTWTDDEIYAAVVDAGLAPDLFSAQGSLAKCNTGWETPAKASAWLKLYRPWRIAKLTSDQAAEKANNGEVWQPQ